MIIWYKNSFLASIISIIGCCGIVGGIGEIMRDPSIRELSLPVAIGLIVGGFILAVLGKIISANKADKNSAKPENPSVSVRSANNSLAFKRAGASIIIAGILFLLATVFGVWHCIQSINLSTNYYYTLDNRLLAEFAVCFILAIAAFWTAGSGSSNVLHILGFAAFTAICIHDFTLCYNAYGFESYFAPDGTQYHAMTLTRLMSVAAYFIMFLLSIFAMRGPKAYLGIIVRIFCFIPLIVLAFVYTKDLSDSSALKILEIQLGNVSLSDIHPTIIYYSSRLFCLMATLFTGFSFCRCCKKEAALPQNAAPSPMPSAPAYAAVNSAACPHCGRPIQNGSVFCEHCGNRIAAVQQPVVNPAPAQPFADTAPAQPAPEQTAKPAVTTNDADITKQLNAYKDLLDCGILSQEEYDQKIRELTHS